MTPLGREARAEPRRLGRVLHGPPRRGASQAPWREAEDVELLMPILLPDPVLLPLSAAALLMDLHVAGMTGLCKGSSCCVCS